MDTGTVRIRLLQEQPPTPPRRRLALLLALFVVVGLVLYGAFSLGERRSAGKSSDAPLAARPGEALQVLDGPLSSEGRFLDPVTREEVDPATAPFQVDLYGTTFYFASRDSFEQFREDPLKYVKARVRVKVRLEPGQVDEAVQQETTVDAVVPPGLAPAGAPVPLETNTGGAEQWSPPTEPPPPVQGDPAAGGQGDPAAGGQGDPAWLPEDPTAPPAAPIPAKPPTVTSPGDDVILMPAKPVEPGPDQGDVVLPPAPGPAGPASPLFR